MPRGTLIEVRPSSEGTIWTLVFQGPLGRVEAYGDHRPTRQAIEALGGLAAIGREFEYDLESWGGLAWIRPLEEET
jgi:hypothetical protein